MLEGTQLPGLSSNMTEFLSPQLRVPVRVGLTCSAREDGRLQGR